MAALFSSGLLVHTRYWCNSTGEVFLGFVSEVAKKVSKPVVIGKRSANPSSRGRLKLRISTYCNQPIGRCVFRRM
jgi:hypothetical protein